MNRVKAERIIKREVTNLADGEKLGLIEQNGDNIYFKPSPCRNFTVEALQDIIKAMDLKG